MSDFRFKAWPTEFRSINQYFGANPQNYAQFGLPGHEGIDIMAPTGSKVFAVAPGTVKMVQKNPDEHNYGTHIRIDHADGYETIYAHLQEVNVQPGQVVEAGSLLGLADNTGNSFGSHLHLTLKHKGETQGDWPNNMIDPTPFLLPLLGIQRPAGPYTSGWAYEDGIFIVDDLAQVNTGGINLRETPSVNGELIDLAPGGTVLSITGPKRGKYYPVQVPTAALNNSDSIPSQPDSDAVLGWAWTNNLTINDDDAISGRFGTNLRASPARSGIRLGTLNEGAQAQIAGKAKGEYTPLYAAKSDISDLLIPLPTVEQPEGLPPTAPKPGHNTTPGWAFTAGIAVSGKTAVVGPYGLNLRNAPRRNSINIGYVPGNEQIIVTGLAQGEYTPVRVDDDILQASFGSGGAGTTPSLTTLAIDPDPRPLGHAKIGLHASADPDIHDNEVQEFKDTRPGIIKVLTHHHPDGIRKLVAQHPNATWIVRAFLDFGERNISPSQFLTDTLSDMKRTLNLLHGKDIVIELHNEPNLKSGGLFSSWADGAAFARWWLELHQLYKQALPSHKFIYPGLSPGGTVVNLKQDHIQFIEASRTAVEAADGLGVHIYWSNIYPMERGLDMLDDYIARFRYKPIYVTQASNNKSETPVYIKGRQYLEFWQALQTRPTVKGVTYFVASASNAAFKEEVWVGRGIGRIVGRR